MNESQIPESELTIEEMLVSSGGWFNIPDSGVTLLLEGAAVLGMVIVMVLGMLLLFRRLKALNQGFSPNSLKSLGVILFLPSLVLLAVLTDFKTETLAALFGTVAGYVLSNTENKSEKSDAARKLGAAKNERD